MAGRDRSAILTFTFAAGHDLVAQAALYTHHQYIGGFFMCGAFAQVALNRSAVHPHCYLCSPSGFGCFEHSTLAGVRPLRALDRTRACNVLG